MNIHPYQSSYSWVGHIEEQHSHQPLGPERNAFKSVGFHVSSEKKQQAAMWNARLLASTEGYSGHFNLYPARVGI
jgi:hypothetical protein